MAMTDYLERSNNKILKFQLDIISIVGFDNPKIEHLENVGFD